MEASILEELQKTPLFSTLTEGQMGCLASGEVLHLERGKILAAEGDPIDSFYVLLEGEMRVSRNYGNQAILMGVTKPGMFLGEISLLLDSPNLATVRALKPCRLFRLSKDGFWQMLSGCPSVANQIFRTMAIRVRNMEGYSHQREKLASLGTMAAGLAHELNNPATAARRASANLREVVDRLQSCACELHEMLTAEHWQPLVDASQAAIARLANSEPLDSVSRSDREEHVSTWLEQQGVGDGWKLAPTFVTARMSDDELASLAGTLPRETLGFAFGWLEASLSLHALLNEVEGSTTRISELVKAVKAYSYMDQSPMQEVDVHDGIDNTLTMLGHKLKNVAVTRKYDRSIPRIMAYGGELNQVWTNLLDNAIDAVKGKGKICVATFLDDDQVVVEIADNGTGIPPEVQSHIFEPFYTTKGVGSGTGLGLVISSRIVANRHGGEIEFESVPGDTRFTVRLPVKQSSNSHGESSGVTSS
ncbi:MAG TPA: ATP-binding protein [Verrucomicrobiae bacterium]|nr:ATP-binding protein [Verrucomicrobiae bacterium]